MDETKLYGLLFSDGKKNKLVKLPIFVNKEQSLVSILGAIEPSSKRLSFMATHGTIREVLLNSGKNSIGYPACIEGSLQFFVLKRSGDVVKEDDEKIILNDIELGNDVKVFYGNISFIDTK